MTQRLTLLSTTEIEKAAALQRDGKLAQAEKIYSRILAGDPRNLDALHLQGLLLHRRGKNRKAVAMLKRAIGLAPQQAVLRYNLGEIHRLSGNFAAAGAAFRQTLEIDPAHVDAYNCLGLALRAQGRMDDAVGYLRKADGLAPGSLGIKMNLGTTLLAAGRASEADEIYRAACALAPTTVEAFLGRADAAAAQGRSAQALAALQQAVRLFPDAAVAHARLGEFYEEQGNARQALQSFGRSLELDSDDVEVWRALGNAYSDLGEIELAGDAYARALRLRPDFAEVICDLGVLAMVQGDAVSAIGRYRKTMRLKPEYTSAYQNLAQAKKYGPGDEEQIRQLETLSTRKNLPTAARASLHFALGKMHDDRGAYIPAFHHYELGNRIKHAETDFDAGALSASVDRLIDTFSREHIAHLAAAGSREETPIFIVGMPRSGTTLIEQILAAHERVFGAGELSFVDRISKRMPDMLGARAGYPDCLRDATPATQDVIRSCATEYLDLTGSLAANVARITDKMPTNFFHLGLIAILFPRARIVHSRRNALDTCLSAYFQHFASGNAWSYDLGDIAGFYREYSRLMCHWRSALPNGLLEIDYETLTADIAATSRRLIEYCDLPWDEACARYHENKRRIATASVWQARQPVYASSVERWRNYEAFLHPLIERLGISK